jgi:hypothetical protein
METKYCKDCKHSTDVPTYKCIHPTYGANLVTGAKVWVHCTEARSSAYYNTNPCGAKGKLFKMKESDVKDKTLFCKIVNLFKKVK